MFGRLYTCSSGSVSTFVQTYSYHQLCACVSRGKEERGEGGEREGREERGRGEGRKREEREGRGKEERREGGEREGREGRGKREEGMERGKECTGRTHHSSMEVRVYLEHTKKVCPITEGLQGKCVCSGGQALEEFLEEEGGSSVTPMF